MNVFLAIGIVVVMSALSLLLLHWQGKHEEEGPDEW